MTLFKNVCIKDLNQILEEGVLPISVTGNNDWPEGRRASNSEDVVYLFEATSSSNSFPQYGLALLEVEVEDAKKNPFLENDRNKGHYEEYIIESVKPEEIKNIYLPNFFKEAIEETFERAVQWVDVEVVAHTEEHPFGTQADETILEIVARTAPLHTGAFNYLRGVQEDMTMIDLSDWVYKF